MDQYDTNLCCTATNFQCSTWYKESTIFYSHFTVGPSCKLTGTMYVTTHQVDIYTSMYLENELHIRYSPIYKVLSARHSVTHHHGGTDFKTWLACLCTGQWHRLWSVWGTLGTPVCTQLAGLMQVPSHQGSLQRTITQSLHTNLCQHFSPLQRLMHRWKDNIKVDLSESGWEGCDNEVYKLVQDWTVRFWYQSQCLAEVVTNTEVHAAFVLTNRAVSDLACDVITDDLGSIFGWVNERLTNQTHSEGDSNKFAIVTLLEGKDNTR